MRRLCALALLMTASAATAQADGGTAPAEHLAPPADPRMALGYAAAAQEQTTREYVPRGETVEDWTRMVTVQSFPVPPGVTPEAFILRWGAMMSGGRAGATLGTPAAVTVVGRAASELTVTCPRNPATGKPETVVARVVEGDGGLLMVQAAARRAFTPDDARWAAGVVAGAAVCPAASTDPRCLATARTDVGAPL